MGLAVTEKDFVMAWLLAFRAGTSAPWIDRGIVKQTVEQAKEIYEHISEGTHETNNGVHEM
jgi:hypothetical protein